MRDNVSFESTYDPGPSATLTTLNFYVSHRREESISRWTHSLSIRLCAQAKDMIYLAHEHTLGLVQIVCVYNVERELTVYPILLFGRKTQVRMLSCIPQNTQCRFSIGSRRNASSTYRLFERDSYHSSNQTFVNIGTPAEGR
jgi:hypothetical protein